MFSVEGFKLLLGDSIFLEYNVHTHTCFDMKGYIISDGKHLPY